MLRSQTASFGNYGATISGSKPLYRPSQRRHGRTRQAPGGLWPRRSSAAAEQDLIVRVSQAYFDTLAASDSLNLVKTQKEAVAQQLASAKRNFEVGTSTITDTREAQARYDLTQAQEIAVTNELAVKSIALSQLTGKADAKPLKLATPVVISPITPTVLQTWVDTAENNHPVVQQARLGLEVAQLETQKALAGKKPTVDLVGSYGITQNNGSGSYNFDNRTNTASIGVAFNLPLYTGHAVQNRIKETLALEDKARSDLEGARRAVAQATRTAFPGRAVGL